MFGPKISLQTDCTFHQEFIGQKLQLETKKMNIRLAKGCSVTRLFELHPTYTFRSQDTGPGTTLIHVAKKWKQRKKKEDTEPGNQN